MQTLEIYISLQIIRAYYNISRMSRFRENRQEPLQFLFNKTLEK